MSFGTRWRLSLMMLLQYATQGAWFAVAGKYFTALGPSHGFTGITIAALYSLLPLATIVAPLAGQMVDRWMHAERLLAALNAASGVLLFALARQTEYSRVWPFMLVYALFYAPTTALTNSISFRHTTDPQRQFSGIRVWGTIGWILAGWALSAWRFSAGTAVPGDLFTLAGGLSLVLAVFCLFLPATPPEPGTNNPLAFLDAVKLLKRRDFLAFVGISFLAYTALDFHYIFGSAYLGTPAARNGLGLSDQALPLVMTIAQLSEIGVMLSLPLLLPRLGIRRAMVVGTAAWALRYAAFAFVSVKAVTIASLALHGFCVSFFFVTIYIYADQIAPRDIRASVQSLVMLILSGAGRLLGSFLAGTVKSALTAPSPGGPVTDWHAVFVIPAAMMLVCVVAFPLLFREREAVPKTAPLVP